jgi:hypothetical protein
MIRTPVYNCARCGGDHASVLFMAFHRCPPDATHWGTCPTTYEPILLQVTPRGPDTTEPVREPEKGQGG